MRDERRGGMYRFLLFMARFLIFPPLHAEFVAMLLVGYPVSLEILKMTSFTLFIKFNYEFRTRLPV